jgi:hypothetical protein
MTYEAVPHVHMSHAATAGFLLAESAGVFK